MPRVSRWPTPVRAHPSFRLAVLGLVVVASVTLGAPPATAQETTPVEPDPAVAQRAGEAWLAGVQQQDGGFAVAGLTGVETPESVLALAGQAQMSDVWSDREAIDRVEALVGPVNGGPNALQALSRLARTADSPVNAALLITRVALPLGLAPTAFDPANVDRPVDLVALLDGSTAEDSVAALSEVVTARVAVGEDGPEPLVTAILDARGSDGAWAAEDGDGQADVATTASVVVALIAAGVPPEDDRVTPGLSVLAGLQNDDGGWGPDGDSRPEDTAAAIAALRAAGFDPDDVCWQEDLGNGATGRSTPSDHLIESQAEDGHWGSEGEALSTAVALQALGGRWLPMARAETRTCGDGLAWPLPAVPPGLLVIVGIGVIGTFGAVRILRDGQPGL